MLLETGRIPTQHQLVGLYDSVGWTAYARDPATLLAAVAGSSFVVTAWDDDALVGLARAVSDGSSICYLQDVLVRADRQRGGVGRLLARTVLERYAHVRQTVLLTDDEPRQAAFYASLGFGEVGAGEFSAVRAFARFS